MDKRAVLLQSSFGERIAEEETDVLETYFVQTDQWARLHRGDIDVVYGPKGAGKSALYSLLLAKSGELFDRGIVLIGGENPRGATAFKDLDTSPPTSEGEFVGLWKLYIVTLIQNTFDEFGITNKESEILKTALSREGLIKGERSLANILHAVAAYARTALRPQALTGQLNVDPFTGIPTGWGGKIVFSEASRTATPESHSVEELLSLADRALKIGGVHVWVLMDRLDVAFAEDVDLESNALRALFRVYLDLNAFSRIQLKIFLRTDIWTRITEGGFREASHITRHVTISWNRNSLLNLIIRRALHNDAVRAAYGVREEFAHTNVSEQEHLFYRLCPKQVEVGPNKPNTIDWILSRTRDGSKSNAPRELIHFLNSLREVQIRRLEVGENSPEGEQLFARPSFKEALPEVSKVRLEQTLLAEYPQMKDWVLQLKGQKTKQTSASLANIWSISQQEASDRAGRLSTVGLFEIWGVRPNVEYWIPFLYRDALELVQGTADQ